MPRLFSVVSVLPSQMQNAISFAELEGEARLLLAVLEDAFFMLERNCTRNDLVGRRQYTTTHEWIVSNDSQWLFSFESICDAFEWDSDTIRGAILNHIDAIRRGEEKPLPERIARRTVPTRKIRPNSKKRKKRSTLDL